MGHDTDPKTRFEDANLRNAIFHNVNLSDAMITDANVTGMRINGVLVADLFAAYEMSKS